MNKLFSFHLNHLPKKHLVVLVAPLLAVVLVFGVLSFAPAAHAASLAQTSSVTRSAVAIPAAGTVEGCPSGYACIYPENKGWNNGHPSLMFYYYGTYPLSNQFGNHYMFNNQTNGSLFWFCTDSNGNTCPKYQPTGTWSQFNLTPIYSVKLTNKNNQV
jgi:hypothetical protein